MNSAAVTKECFVCWHVKDTATMCYNDCQFLRNVHLKFPSCVSVNERIIKEDRYFSAVLISVLSHPH